MAYWCAHSIGPRATSLTLPSCSSARSETRGDFSTVTAPIPVMTAKRLLADIRIAVAAEERRKISQRTREGLARARRAGVQLGRPCRIPAEVIARIVELNRRGKSAQAIAKQLTGEGVPTPGGGTNWAHSTVRAALRRYAQQSKDREQHRN
jgi:Recombinase/Resolvase, N terminal domain